MVGRIKLHFVCGPSEQVAGDNKETKLARKQAKINANSSLMLTNSNSNSNNNERYKKAGRILLAAPPTTLNEVNGREKLLQSGPPFLSSS